MYYILAEHDEYDMQYLEETCIDIDSVRKFFDSVDPKYHFNYTIIEGEIKSGFEDE